MGVAVVGCGGWGKNLVRNFSELGALECICDYDDSTSSMYSAKFGVPSLSFDEVLKSCVEGIVIATPAPLHASFSIESLYAGKHVYVEKPMAMNLDEANLMIDAAKNSGKHLMVGHLMQYHPVFRKLLSLVHSNELGKIHYIYSNRLSLGKIRSQENVIWSFAPHDVSMILSLVRAPVKSVYCEAKEILQTGIADIGTLHIVFENDVNAHVFCSWLHPYKEQKLVVIGEKGIAVFNDTSTNH